jgi:hypothetical protein
MLGLVFGYLLVIVGVVVSFVLNETGLLLLCLKCELCL